MKKVLKLLIILCMFAGIFFWGYFFKKSIDDRKINYITFERDKIQSQNPIEVRNCIYEAADEWQKEINRYMDLLKQNTTPEEYKIIQDSQIHWIKQNKKNFEVISKFIYEHGGTMYYDIGAADFEQTVENRAEFLRIIYDIYKDESNFKE